MHKLESFALSVGSKIEKPFIDKNYYPILDEKFICVSQESISNSKNYSNFNDVMFHIKPFLEDNGINVIELGSPDSDSIFYTKNYKHTSRLQANFIINKSLLYFGNFNYYANIASALNKPIVLPSNKDIESSFKPYWSTAKSCKVLMAETDLMPSRNDDENPKTINLIHPELIAKSILDLLNIENDLDTIETIFIGDNYHSPTLDLIPSNFQLENFKNQKNINVRLDKKYDINFLVKCKTIKSLSITTDQDIPRQVLTHLKDHIDHITFYIDKNTTIETINNMQSIGKPLFLLCKNKEDLKSIQLKFIDHPVVLDQKLSKKDLKVKNLDNLIFLSKKNIISEGKAYNSFLSLSEGRNVSKVLNKKVFWEDLKYCRVYKKT
tara:strand:+ start:2382 stop:3521 length:1140 start_codon:yes stop_codon:yes gene_type:complete